MRSITSEFVGCPDPRFPDVCHYNLIITLDYAAPFTPAVLSCRSGLFGANVGEQQVSSPSGTVTISVQYEVILNGAGGFRLFGPEAGARCLLMNQNNGLYVDVTAETILTPP